MRVHVTEEDRPINPAVEFEVAPASEVEAALARLHAESVLAPRQGLVHHAYGGRGVRPQVHRPHLGGDVKCQHVPLISRISVLKTMVLLVLHTFYTGT